MSEIDKTKLQDELARDEGYRDKPYKDSVGILTIGYGHNLNIPMCKEALQVQLTHDIRVHLEECRGLPYWDTLDPVRRRVVCNMVFNLGMRRFLKFNRLNIALLNGNYNSAAVEMMDSKWFNQVGNRAERLVKTMETGEEIHLR